MNPPDPVSTTAATPPAAGPTPDSFETSRTRVWLRRTLAVVGAIAILYGLLQYLPPRGAIVGPNPWRSPDGRRPLVIAHGGGERLHPDNTLAAFEHSSTTGCDVLEMDLRLSKDGALVTLHDAKVDRTSDGQGLAIDLTVAELKALNFGFKFKDPSGHQPYRTQPARLATLEEMFTRFPQWPMILELKDRERNGAAAAAELHRLIQRHGMSSRVIVASFDDATLAEFRRVSSGAVATAPAMEATRQWVLLGKVGLSWFAPAGDHALQIPVAKAGHRLDTPELIREAHRRNMAVHYWTINDPAEMKRLIALGADGLMTDRPDILRTVLAELGLSVPPAIRPAPTP